MDEFRFPDASTAITLGVYFSKCVLAAQLSLNFCLKTATATDPNL
jgi:hypothetical protein